MNVKQIISAEETRRMDVGTKEVLSFPHLLVSEFYCDTIQGEGIYTGVPATFLRLKGCPLGCSYCDTTEVWKHGNAYSFGKLFELMYQHEVPHKLYLGQHLVITGGSPLLQQDYLGQFIEEFINYFHFKPFIEIENECFYLPSPKMKKYVDCWNNSPKLGNSGVRLGLTYRPEVLKVMAHLPNSWFKFVISKPLDWEEIKYNFLLSAVGVEKSQIILMPEGATRAELEKNRERVVQLAIDQGVRYCTREHIVLWDKKVGT